MTCLDLGDGRILVGDTIFIGGPGKTCQHRLCHNNALHADDCLHLAGYHPLLPWAWTERDDWRRTPAFEAFTRRGWSTDIFGDVTWT